jgi:very-short-patch-repair endonuclease
MTKLEFVAKQLAKSQTKKYEHYVVYRIWHRLDNLTIKPITQQFVSRPSGRAVTDLFFPQFNIHIEVDEKHHKRQIDADQSREADIISATGHEVLHVDVTQPIEEINNSVEMIIDRLLSEASHIEFIPWDLEKEMDPLTYIRLGYLDVADNVAFGTIAEAATCFGRDYRNGMQQSYFPHPSEDTTKLWFPRLYPNADWNNQLSADENVITYASFNPDRRHAHIDEMIADAHNFPTRIVFARVIDPLGARVYKFKGSYQFDFDATNYDDGIILNRIATRVDTYPFPGFEGEVAAAESDSDIVETLYKENVLTMSDANRLKLAALILRDLAVSET